MPVVLDKLGNKKKLKENLLSQLPQPNYPFMIKGDLDEGGITLDNLIEFQQKLADNLEDIKKRYPSLSPKSQEAISFLKSRYPNFFSRSEVPISQVTNSQMSGGYYPEDNRIELSSNYPGNVVGTLAHELQHKLQWRNPESVRSNLVLGAYPNIRANNIAANMNPGNYADQMAKYSEIPQEKYAIETGNMASNEFELFKKLMRLRKPVISNQ